MEQIVPREKWLYNDRGMMKWMGWLLSDHSAFMEGEEKKERYRPVRSEMNETQIDERLRKSWEKGKLVSIQLNIVENNQFVPEINGTIISFDINCIYVQLNSGAVKLLHIEEIRSVEFMEKNER